MILKSVENLQAFPSKEKYDVSLFACGFESRCIKAASLLPRKSMGYLIVSRFLEYLHTASRDAAEEFFQALKPDYFSLNSVSDYAYVGEQLRSSLGPRGEKKIFVDYSSMPRTWYGAVLNFLRSLPRLDRVVVDFCYVPGQHDANLPVVEVRGMSTVAGFEGVSGGSARTAAIFSLGFEKWTPYAALERVEPNEVICITAEPGAKSEYAGRAQEINAQFVQDNSSELHEFDIRDVARAFGFLSDMAVLKLNSGCDVALVGMGPKTHTLSMLLAAVRFPEITVIHIRRTEYGPRDVPPLPIEICTRVVFEGLN